MIKPIGDKVLVREDERPEREGLIYRAPMNDGEVWEPTYGEVVSVGEGKKCNRKTDITTAGDIDRVYMTHGLLVPPDVQPGDRVAYDPWRGSHFEHDGIGYRLLERDEVLAVLESA